MGAVNKCWRCGAALAAVEPSLQPPVRRAPVNLSDAAVLPVRSQPIVSVPPADTAKSDPPSQAAEPLETPRSPFLSTKPAAVNTGSAPVSPRTTPAATARAASPPQDPAAIGGAIAVVVLGCLSLSFSRIVPLGSILTALLGFPFGIWGLYSERRSVAIFGLLLCCLGLSVGGFFGVMELYAILYADSPLDPAANIPP